MNRLARVALAVALTAGLAASAGCSVADGGVIEIDLENSLGDEKSDSISGKKLVTIVTEEIIVQPRSSYVGRIDVETIDDAIVEVTGARLMVPVEPNQRLRLSVEVQGFDLFTTLKLVVLVSIDGSSFQQVEFHGSGGDLTARTISVNYFDRIELHPGLEWASFIYDDNIFTREFTGARDLPLEYALLVFPESGWGSLTGSYDYRVTVSP